MYETQNISLHNYKHHDEIAGTRCFAKTGEGQRELITVTFIALQ